MTVNRFFPSNSVLINSLFGGIIGLLTILTLEKIRKGY